MIHDSVQQTIASYQAGSAPYISEWKDFSMKKTCNYFLNLMKEKNLHDKPILDVGCGFGRDLKYFRSCGNPALGIDMTPAFLDYAKRIVPSSCVSKMDMRHLLFPPAEFGGIWACSSFQHIPLSDARKTLDGFRRVLVKDGVLFLSAQEGKGYELRQQEDGTKRLYVNYSKESLEALVQKANFSVLGSVISLNHKNRSWITLFAHAA